MAETEKQEDTTLPAKRKPDLLHQDDEVNAKKIHKLQTLNTNTNTNTDDMNNTPVSESIVQPELAAEPQDEAEEEDEEDYDDEDSNGKAVVDRKGKGILRDDKGKGKLIEQDSDDDDDDASDSDDDTDFGESESDSDLSDDPLAEVDLDNILPSRTRRRAAQPGFRIANDRDVDA